MRPNSRHMSAFFFFRFSMCHINLIFSSTLKTFLVLVIISMLLCCQSPVNCRRMNIKGNFMHKMNYCYCYFPCLEFIYTPERVEASSCQGQGGGWIFKTTFFLESDNGTNDSQCRYIPGRCSVVCCSKQGRKPRELRGIKWYQRIAKMLHKPRSL